MNGNERRRAGVGHREAKDELFAALASVAKALSSGRRAEIIDLLMQGDRSVDEIATEIDQSLANTSHHLHVLARAGLLRSRREGTRVVYGLADDQVARLWTAVRGIAATHVAEVERLAAAYLGERNGLEPVSREELARRLRRGDVTVVDVRPVLEYEAGHVAGARSLPVTELKRRLGSLPRDVEIVAYCRGPYCVYADDAVRMLRSRGLEARRLEDGLPEWKDAGLPVAAGGEDEP